MRLVAIAPSQIERVWPRLQPWLAAADDMPGCDLTADDLKTICLREEGQMTVVLDAVGRSVAAGVTQVRDYADGLRSCWVLRLGGSASGTLWREVIAAVEAGAERNGCAVVEFVGRRGWTRILRDYAATPCEAGTHYAKRL